MDTFNMNDRTLEEGEIEEELLDDRQVELNPTRRRSVVGQNREWPLTYLHHIKGEKASSIRAPSSANNSYPPARCKTIKVPRETRVRPKFVRRFRHRQSGQRHPVERNKDSRDQFSYEDLLSQYRDIQSQLEELKQEEDSARIEKGKDGKENVKSSKRKSSTVTRRISSRSRRHIRSRSKSSANDSSKSKSPQVRSDDDGDDEEDEEVQELRRIALASAKDKTKTEEAEKLSGIKKSPGRRSSCKPSDAQISSAIVESMQNDKSQHMQSHLYDNYEQVAMELDSNYSGEDEDEQLLRSTLLLSLNQKKVNNISSIKTAVTVPAKVEEKEIKKVSPLLLNMQPPLHGPVVINLGEDTTDSESESESQQNFAANDIQKVTNETKVLKMGSVPVQNRISTKLVNDAKSERHLKLIRILKKDCLELNQLKTSLHKKRLLLIEAEKKAKQLTEQLAAANKIVMANQASIVKISNQIKVAQARAAERRAQVKKVFSREKILANKSAVVLRNQVTNQASIKKQRSQQLAEEKKRLLKREQEIAIQLRLLHRRNSTPSSKVASPAPAVPINNETENNVIAQNNTCAPQSKPNNISKRIVNTQHQVEKCISTISSASAHNLDLFALTWVENLEIPLNLPSDSNPHSMSSPLSHFKAFRLTKFYDGKFTSSTYANKLDPNWTLCSFDLRGTCNDDQCPWQHSTHYAMTPEETLVDLAMYAPSVLGVNLNLGQQQVENAVSELVKPLLKNESSLEEACSKLAQEIMQTDEHMILDRRKFVSQRQRKSTKMTGIRETVEIEYRDVDGDDEGKRYFSHATQKPEDLEEILKGDPTNVDLWLRLAELSYKNRVKTSIKTFDRTLHILSRALESNRTNEKLWLKYLSIYGHHPKNEDFVELCRQAFEFAPSFEIGELYLKSSSDKFEVCDLFWRFLESGVNTNTKELNSTKALQLLLKQTQLHVENNIHGGIRFLHGYLKGDPSPLLLPHHMSFAWLIVLHLTAFSSFPFNLFSGFFSLGFDSPFVISWTSMSSPGKLLPVFKDAIYSSQRWDSPKDAFVIYWNLIELHMHCKDWDSAKTECRNAILKCPNLIDPVILHLKVLHKQSDERELLIATQSAVFQYQYSCRLRFVAALVAFKYESVEAALSVLTALSKELCGETMLEPSCCFKNVLNLNQKLTIGKTKPSVIETNELVYVWLSFSLYLFLDGQDPSYNLDTALIRVACPVQRILIWSFYLCLKSRKNTVSWLQLVKMYLNSVDVLSQMDLTDSVCGFLSDEGKLNFLDTIYDWLPNNSHVLLRYLQVLNAKGDDTTVAFVARDAEVAAMSLEAALLSIQSASRVLSDHQFSSLRSRFASFYPLESAFRSNVSESSRVDDALLSREGNCLNKMVS